MRERLFIVYLSLLAASTSWTLFCPNTKPDGIGNVKELFIGQLYLYYGIIIGEETVAVIHFLIYLAVIVLQLALFPAAPTELEDYYE